MTMTYKDCVKSKDTDGIADTYVMLPIAFLFTKLFNKLHFTPNMVSITSGIFGIGAGVCFYFDNVWINLLGVLLMFFCAIFDDSDGQLARMTKRFSPIGRMIDGTCDSFVVASVYFALLFRYFDTNIPFTDVRWGWWLALYCTISGFCQASQCRMADYFRNLHLYFLKGKGGCELDRTKNMEVHRFYWLYTKMQEIKTKNTNRLLDKIDENGGVMSEELRADFLKGSKILVHFTKWLTFNLRTLVLCILVPLDLGLWWMAFVIVVMTIMLIMMDRLYERLAKKLLKKHFGA